MKFIKCCFPKFLFVVLFFVYCSYNNKSIEERIEDEYEAVAHIATVADTSVFISTEDQFGEEFVFRPGWISISPFEQEKIFIADVGQNKVFVFNQEKKLLKILGQSGQGPGDLLFPQRIEFDKDGKIYIHDSYNQRISIFYSNGKFYKSARVIIPSDKAGFSVVDENHIICNLYNSDYYITVINAKGEIVKQIGEIVKYQKDRFVNQRYAMGFPFYDERREQYCIFLTNSGRVRFYNNDGKFLFEKMFNLPGTKTRFEIGDLLPPEESPTGGNTILFFNDVQKYDDSYIVISHGNKTYNVGIYVVNNNIDIMKIIYVPISNEVSSEISYGRETHQFGVSLEKGYLVIPGGNTFITMAQFNYK